MRRGFTMIEVMVAGAILAIGCLGILAMQLTTINYNRQAHMRTQAVTLAEQQLAILEAAATDKNNWTAGTGIIAQLKALAPTGKTWMTPTNFQVNVNGMKSSDITPANGLPKADFAIGYYVLQDSDVFVANPSGGNQPKYIRGAIRVVWNRKADGNCLTANTLSGMDDTGNANFSSNCDFISLPFALVSPASSTVSH